ncbi:MAG: type II toxin-antitoxin system HicA family toxin [Gemmatimonadota bacterium]|nr:type II toxin-antitoxin system HicA family toxin [Gemmatimonadota bacterium]MDE2676497.1 type II toxin-antitoxin system HicA family toxin [Gemmatimonadota bacterium]
MDIRWRDIEAALRACGVEFTERAGSRVGLRIGRERMIVHRPHPGPNAGRATVRDIAAFLRSAGVEP